MSPLYAGRVAEALALRKNDFRQSQEDMKLDMKALQDALDRFLKLKHADIDAAIAAIEFPGARPTAEQDEKPLIVPFAGDWSHHRAAREWADSILAGVPTFAADGSQIFPSKDMSVPVGLVQIGWFENPHNVDGSYVKDVQVDVLPPNELDSGEPGAAEREIERRRFYGEVLRTMMFMEHHADERALAFFDGSLILSFVHTMREDRQRDYISLVTDMLDYSEKTQVPVVGYIDTSYAADLTTLLRHTARYEGSRVGDATMLSPLMKWGDRSRLYVCARDDEVVDKSYYERVGFTYLKTTKANPPARVELPRWVFEQGLHEWVLDIVRAECVVGVGYPYPIETADAVAVLSMQDRERFYRLFQGFAAEQGIKVRFSRKSVSKRGRRI